MFSLFSSFPHCLALGCAQTATRMGGHATKRPCVYDRRSHTAIMAQHGGRFLLVFRELDDGSPSFQRVFHTPHCAPHDSVGFRIRTVQARKSGEKLMTTWETFYFALREARSSTPACRCATDKHLPLRFQYSVFETKKLTAAE